MWALEKLLRKEMRAIKDLSNKILIFEIGSCKKFGKKGTDKKIAIIRKKFFSAPKAGLRR
jgi:hypothetical protein